MLKRRRSGPGWKRGTQGFTIIELIIVVIVIGILASAGLGKYQNFAETARTRTCISNIKGIETGAAVWAAQNIAFREDAEGGSRFAQRSGRTYGSNWGTYAAAFQDTAISSTIKDNNIYICPSQLQLSCNGDRACIDDGDRWNSGCVGPGWTGRQHYVIFYGCNGCGSFNGGHNWYQDNMNAGRLVAWCAPWGGFQCGSPTGESKQRHTVRW